MESTGTPKPKTLPCTNAAQSLVRGKLQSALSALGLVSVMFLAACGGDDNENNKTAVDPVDELCKDVTCDDGGVCKEGMCENAADCAGEDSNCIAGYLCSPTNACVPRFACSNSQPCDRGSCSDLGACINADTCANTGECLAGFACGGDSKCIADPCQDDDQVCDRGVCQVGTGSCVNAQVCQSDTEGVDCLEGFRCSAGTCKDETGYCGDVDCSEKGGVCNFAATSEDDKCINAPNCGGEDSNCLKGFFCAEDGTCQEDKCEENGCMDDGGVCDKASGSCVNPATCDNKDACLNDHFCVANACVPTADACMTAGCTGAQVCENDDATLTAVCKEGADGCQSALDCLDDRVCDETLKCAAPVACVDDVNEPNNTDAEATDYFDARQGVVVRGSICGQDVDVIKFDTQKDVEEKGQLVVDLQFASDRSLGLGELKVELVFNGMVVETGVTQNGRVRIERPISIAFVGEYFVRISPEGTINDAGIPYQVNIDLLDDLVVSACMNAKALAENAPESSSTNSGSSTAIAASCADPSGLAFEDIYTITLAQKSELTVIVDPGDSSDVSVSLRSECLVNETEVPGACSEVVGEGAVEQIRTLLDPGTYFVIVQGADDTKGGTYEITWNRRDVVCTASDSRCVSAQSAEICRGDGQGYTVQSCDNGCNQTVGACNPLEGEVCGTAVKVDEMNPLENYTVQWSKLKNDYGIAVGGCVEATDGTANVTSGPDQAFEVTIPPNHVVVANVSQEQTAVGAKTDAGVYIIEDCLNTDGTCLVGANGGDGVSFGPNEEAFFANDDPMASKTVFVIVDTVNSGQYVQSLLNISVEPKVCEPGTSRCGENPMTALIETELCNASGTAYGEPVECTSGTCAFSGVCGDADLCPSAPLVESGFTETLDIGDDFTDTVSVDATCAGFTTGNGAEDAFYAIEVPDAQILEVTVERDGGFGDEPAIFIFEDCADVNNTCVAGDLDPDNARAIWANTTGASKVVLIGISSEDTFLSADYDVTINLKTPECMVPRERTCLMDGNVSYCNDSLLLDTITCNGGCDMATARCTTPQSDTCFDAIVLDKAATTISGSYADSNNSVQYPERRSGECFVGDNRTSDGRDRVYEVVVAAGERFQASLTSTSTSTTFQMFLFNDCADPIASCVAYDDKRNLNGLTIDYVNTSMADETLFLLVDATSNQTSDFDIAYSFTANSVCVPDSSLCDAAGTGLQTCSADGLTIDPAVVACPGMGTCDSGRCSLDVMTADTCATAPKVESGTSFLVDFQALTLNQSLTDESCTGDATSTADAFFSVDVPTGKVLQVTVDSLGQDKLVAYVVEDCAMAQDTCLVGTEIESVDSYVGELAWANIDTANPTKTVTVGVAETDSFGGGYANVKVEIVDPECPTAGVVVCNNDDLRLCNNNLQFEDFPCDGTCGTIVPGKCDTPAGDVCLDTITLTGVIGSVQSTYAGATNRAEIPSGVTGACTVFNFDESDEGDRFFEVELAPGELIRASVTSSETTAQVYITSTCGDPVNSCLANGLVPGSGTTASYLNSSAARETVFVTVDNHGFNTNDAFTLDYEIVSGLACVPGQFQCDMAGTGTQRCKNDGSGFDPVVACGAGLTCSNGVCEQDAAIDTCAMAPVVAGNYSVSVTDFGTLTDTVNPGSSSCADGTTSGPDFFYKVTVPQNKGLRVNSQSFDSDTHSTYIFTDCMNPSSSCIDGERATFSNGYAASASLFNDDVANPSTDYIVAVDASSSFAGGPTGLEVEVYDPECLTPNTATCVNGASEACTAARTVEVTQCANTCGTITPGECDPPLGDACAAPIVVPVPTAMLPQSIVETGNYANFTATQNNITSSGCTGFAADGRDAIYQIDLPTGVKLDVNLSSSADTSLYILDACGGGDSACLVGDDGSGAGGSESVSYTNGSGSTQTIFVIADLFSATVTSADFTLLLTFSTSP